MPFKHNASRSTVAQKRADRVANWPAYEAGLSRRTDVTFWLDEKAVKGSFSSI